MPLAFSYLEYSEDKVVSLLGDNSMKLDIRFTRQHKVLINGSKLLSCCTVLFIHPFSSPQKAAKNNYM